MTETRLTHLAKDGEVNMVNVGDKTETQRIAIAEGRINMSPKTLELIKSANTKKGDVLAVARVAGIMAAKKTSELIPLCHSIMLTNVDISLELEEDHQSVFCQVTSRTTERTGVEMEALVGVQIALLTVYDMCKSVDRAMEITDVRLVHKAGGKSGEWNRES
ncbi:MAG: cyclic pyranopterin monophosphate synthase MoaC [Gammaproteobacteria bacterium]|nr:cyclic pyranopterin monophosphate synthase MoaC [Gammaproteobacteria bacterium]MCY4217701.1 cyclic pyranopterin monophosphate synthase MoaC [Gammaproteobacteria bacterium]MCY4275046.1 cyclic pyranopterin monophosphate synthase MoaC [Gammaproteobacteria bacterium]